MLMLALRESKSIQVSELKNRTESTRDFENSNRQRKRRSVSDGLKFRKKF